MLVHLNDPIVTPNNEMTCEALELLAVSARQLQSTLKAIQRDLTLINTGYELVHALDFSVIFSLLYPEQSRVGSSCIARGLISSGNISTTLPPGAVIELIKSLHLYSSKSLAKKSAIDEFLARPFVASILNVYQNSKYTSLESDGMRELIASIFSDASSMADIDGQLRTLENLQLLKRLTPFSNFFTEQKRPAVNQEILFRCFSSLNLRRPGEKDINNFIDAHNYSCTYHGTEQQADNNKRIFLLVTGSPRPYHVFRNIRWIPSRSLLSTNLNEPMSLVRHPIQVLYLEKILENGRNGTNYLKSMVRDLENLCNSWTSIAKFKKFKEKNSRVLPTARIRLPRNRPYLKSYYRFRELYDHTFSGIRAAIEADVVNEENLRSLKSVGVSAVGVEVFGELRPEGVESSVTMPSIRHIYGMFDDLTEVTYQIIDRLTKDIELFTESDLVDIDTENFVTNSRKLTISEQRSQVSDSTEFLVKYTPNGKFFMACDLSKDFLSLWWNTNVTFNEFLEQVRIFIAHARMMPKPNTNKRKIFSGIYLYGVQGIIGTPVPMAECEGFELDTIIQRVGRKNLKMVRFATELGDLWYDLVPYKGLSQRAGVTTHFKHPEPISWLVKNTCSSLVPVSEVTRAAKYCIRRMKK